MIDFTEKDIPALDFIIDRLHQGYLQIYPHYLLEANLININPNEIGAWVIINNEFNRLMYIIDSYKCADCHFDEDDDIGSYINPNSQTSFFKAKGGFKKAYSDLIDQRYHSEIIKQTEINNLKLSKWQVRSFWYIFVFGLIGGLYSAFDIIKEVTTKESEKNITKEELQSEVEQLKSLILKSKVNTETSLKTINHPKTTTEPTTSK